VGAQVPGRPLDLTLEEIRLARAFPPCPSAPR